ncbi:cytochrome c biogenesis protein ResB [Thermosulfurimonas sp. F29]|uniref:cytochrome c biogenesis protein ResB n=1 Tax=Thermosulfurimonas sp. F29 TaxID=2867247 RepID=UPI001C8367CC|nr:cytochrome c biogenesis protein ResB [Thermosulfurimonas sp. F29]MBX6422969.1 cytochrome c biogenesis protein ResB [Thermosulfurimonas sp. F29]
MKKLVDLLSSLRLAIFLFLALAGTSILGTIIPQGREPGFYLSRYGTFWGKIINFLSLYDAYHSWWYVALLSLFLANLIFCSLKRFPVSLRLFRKDPFSVDPEKIPLAREITVPGSPEEIKKFLKNFHFKSLKEGELGVKDRYRWSYFAVYFVHGSIIVIVIGALIGALFGYRGSMNILEGEVSNKVFPFRRHHGFITLPFQIKLEKFEIEFYPNGAPKDYRSHVKILDGANSFEYLIRVNHPLEYRGIKFYQASYQEYATIRVRVKTSTGKEKEILVKPFEDGQWPEEQLTIGLIRYARAHGFRMAQVWITKGGSEPRMLWLIEGHRETISFSPEKVSLTLVGTRPIFMTGLQVRKDPGAFLVYLGCVLMILGVFATFFCTHRRIWVYLVSRGHETRIIAGGYSKRYREDLRREIERLLTNLKSSLT